MTEAERLDAVKLAVELGNDVNAHADFGDYRMDGDVDYTLLYYPHNIDELLDLGVGDPRWSGSTPLIGAVMSGQPSIVQYLVDRGADVDAKTDARLDAAATSREGVFCCNAKKEFPAAAAIIKKAMAAQAAAPAAVPGGRSGGAPAAPVAWSPTFRLTRSLRRLPTAGASRPGPDFNAAVLRRTSAGQVEIHRKETDIFYIVEGEATFVTGGKMIGGKESRPDQLLGTDIEGGQVHQLKKGDFIVIPAGVPHWFKEVAKPINYYMVKVVKP